mmetsp:Transcript_47924/g.139681  ORF Transcript_47924/g.139681 Transcript_47924/m.139681 type:complete len:241 (+) Transcript_47924:667-1389(+)
MAGQRPRVRRTPEAAQQVPLRLGGPRRRLGPLRHFLHSDPVGLGARPGQAVRVHDADVLVNGHCDPFQHRSRPRWRPFCNKEICRGTIPPQPLSLRLLPRDDRRQHPRAAHRPRPHRLASHCAERPGSPHPSRDEVGKGAGECRGVSDGPRHGAGAASLRHQPDLELDLHHRALPFLRLVLPWQARGEKRGRLVVAQSSRCAGRAGSRRRVWHVPSLHLLDHGSPHRRAYQPRAPAPDLR